MSNDDTKNSLVLSTSSQLAAKAEILSVCVSHTPEGDQGYSEGHSLEN